MEFYAVILAGGRGERFWPVGRVSRPKQFVSLFGGKPLIRHAVDRLEGLIPAERILVVTNRDLVDATCKALPNLPKENILGEPQGRDTAAACALATAWVQSKGGENACMSILTADHLIADAPAFRAVLGNALQMVSMRPVLSVIGIKPTYAATGYGYVKVRGSIRGSGLPRGFRAVERFVEKPNLGTAATYLESGNYWWNSGMFVWQVRIFREALAKFCPALDALSEKLVPLFGTASFDATLEKWYGGLEKISVDYAVMEKAANLVGIRGDFGWDDVGTWVCAGTHFKKDTEGNAVYGLVRSLVSSGNTVVNTQDGHLIALMGLQDLVVVHTEDATLVCSRESADGLKALVKEIGKESALEQFVR
ncbi:MAG: mannose-1-phosphate guanylyltransferase [Kiritimatiellia bacterium]